MGNKLQFDLKKKQSEVILKEGEVEKKYYLREFTGEQKGQFLTQLGERAVITDGKIIGFKSFEGFQTILVSLCFYDEQDILVPEAFVKNLPATVLDGLFEEAKKLNGLDIESGKKEEAKKD